MRFKTILLLLGCLFFSCTGKDPDFNKYILNKTDIDINVRAFFKGIESRSIDIINSGSNHFFGSTGRRLGLDQDSIVIKQTDGDSIVYHHPVIENSNYEQTKARSYFSECNWTEIVDENRFEYTVLPEDFQ